MRQIIQIAPFQCMTTGSGVVHETGVICDWTTGVHRYREPVKPFESGRILRKDRDGKIEWEKMDWEKIKCPSSDTSIRISCDGERLRFMGNIGRFQQEQNVTGIPLVACMDRWVEVLGPMGLDLNLFGTVHNQGSPYEAGTTLSRVDLAGNFQVSDYQAWCRILMMRSLGRQHPRMGKYGPQWGSEKRSNWLKAKVYDKDAEQAGERGPRHGATLARLEFQLGSEFLKREKLNYVHSWVEKEGKDMGQIIYGRFAAQLFRDQATVESWDDIPSRIRHHAILWRDGIDVRAGMSPATYYRVKARLLEFGLDISIPCNITAISTRTRSIEVTPVSALREAA